MTQQCEFPGCENDATATYCRECRQSVQGARRDRLVYLVIVSALWMLAGLVTRFVIEVVL